MHDFWAWIQHFDDNVNIYLAIWAAPQDWEHGWKFFGLGLGCLVASGMTWRRDVFRGRILDSQLSLLLG